jgi:hypothetical protein
VNITAQDLVDNFGTGYSSLSDVQQDRDWCRSPAVDEDLYSEGALFQIVFVTSESLFNDVPEQTRIAFTGGESTVAHRRLG